MGVGTRLTVAARQDTGGHGVGAFGGSRCRRDISCEEEFVEFAKGTGDGALRLFGQDRAHTPR